MAKLTDEERAIKQAQEEAERAARAAEKAEKRAQAEQLALQIGEYLGETSEQALEQFAQIALYFSHDFATSLVHEVEAIEAGGGMMTKAGDRRRTPGGVYLYLARERAETGKQRRIFYQFQEEWLAQQTGEAQYPAFEWDNRFEIIEEIWNEHGEATTVKITLIGRPGKIDRRRDVVITTVTHKHKLPLGLPKGVPQPPAEPTTYTVYIGAKQWNKVEDAITRNQTDQLIIEGTCAFEPRINGMAVFAQMVTTKQIQAAKNPPKPQSNDSGDGADAAPAKPAAQGSQGSQGTARPASSISPAQAKQRLMELHRAESELRESYEELKSLPPEEQGDMMRTFQELQRTKDEIKTLRQQFPDLR